jgi:hypothetical protein
MSLPTVNKNKTYYEIWVTSGLAFEDSVLLASDDVLLFILTT